MWFASLISRVDCLLLANRRVTGRVQSSVSIVAREKLVLLIAPMRQEARMGISQCSMDSRVLH